jgi:hypothetical protein
VATNFTCQCGSLLYVSVERYLTNGQLAPYSHHDPDGFKPVIRCIRCNTTYQFDVEVGHWQEVKTP